MIVFAEAILVSRKRIAKAHELRRSTGLLIKAAWTSPPRLGGPVSSSEPGPSMSQPHPMNKQSNHQESGTSNDQVGSGERTNRTLHRCRPVGPDSSHDCENPKDRTYEIGADEKLGQWQVNQRDEEGSDQPRTHRNTEDRVARAEPRGRPARKLFPHQVHHHRKNQNTDNGYQVHQELWGACESEGNVEVPSTCSRCTRAEKKIKPNDCEHQEQKPAWFTAVAPTIQNPARQTDGEAEDRTRNRNRNELSRHSRGGGGVDPHLVKRGTEPEHIACGAVAPF